MDTQMTIKSLAELEAEALQAERAQELAEYEADLQAERENKTHWDKFLAQVEADLHPDMLPYLDREQPGSFNRYTNNCRARIALPGHALILRYFYHRDGAWTTKNEEWIVLMPEDQPNLSTADLGKALLWAKRQSDEERQETARRERLEREEAEKQAETARRQAEVRASVEATAIWTEDKPAPEPTPAEILVDAVDGFIRDYLSRNGYSPVD